MNHGDVVRITKIIEEWNNSGVKWPQKITQAMIDNGLYGIYRQTVDSIGPMVKIKNSYYYFPEESLELVENSICVNLVQKTDRKWYLMDSRKLGYFNKNFEIVSRLDAIKFDLAIQAEIYIKENLLVLTSPEHP